MRQALAEPLLMASCSSGLERDVQKFGWGFSQPAQQPTTYQPTADETNEAKKPPDPGRG